MDMTTIRNKLPEWIRKNRYVLLILLLGVALMLLPGRKSQDDEPIIMEETKAHHVEPVSSERLCNVLCQIKGAGKVEVLLTYATGEKVIYQSDDHSTTSGDSSTLERETVIVSNGSREESALVSQVLYPEYLGAVVVCQGADDPAVRLAVSEAVSKATGLGTDRISVLKMK